MFLQRLWIRNLRSIRALELSFRAPGEKARAWTYLLGENGTGKSSVLKAIGLVMAGGDALYELIGEPDDWIRLGETEAAILVDFTTQDDEPRHAELVFQRGETSNEFVMRNHAALSDLDAAIDRSDRNYFVVAYGVSRRPIADERFAFSRSGFKFRSPRAQAVGSLFNPDASLVALEQWAMDLEYRRGDDGLVAIRNALNTLLPDVNFAEIDKEQRRVLFETPDGLLPLSALSDGYQAMAGWCGDLLWQITETFKDYRDPLKARGLLLVDELDLHLHPTWQRRLVSFLKETLPNVQVVVTTHSPLTVHQAGENELHVLRRSADGVTIDPYAGAPNRLMLHQLLQSPLFGLETLDSPQVEAVRDEIRALQGVGQPGEPSAADEREARRLKKSLAGIANWRETQPYLHRTNDVLERIAKELAPDGEDDPVQRLTQPPRPRPRPGQKRR